ncbi:cell surface protein [Desulfonema ishimotonii]|uniref:Cell surface protein n=1 Tax=Desulfonema ishimotonii TaxID=45657 RepID=A0A401G3I5_9BACT|nr:PQQ-binding-like beta-propeller repeat protein [Desulfonema ishimotonii]GBC63808.1 cell surface protein [Desulfonema ishimotonii]
MCLFLMAAAPMVSWAKTGEIRWNLNIGSRITASPAIGDDGTIYVAADAALYAIEDEGDGGSVRWTAALGSTVFTPVIASDGAGGLTIYVATAGGRLYAIAAKDGTAQWDSPFETGETIAACPALDGDGVLYIGTTAGRLYAVQSEDGKARWSRPFTTDGGISAAPVTDTDGVIYVGTASGRFYAVSPDGTEKWNSPFGADGAISAAPAIGSDGTLYFGTSDGKLYAVGADGTKKWNSPFSADGELSASPSISSSGVIYIGTSAGKLYAVRSDGTAYWSDPFEADGALYTTPVIGEDGKLYFGSWGGRLYALYADGDEVKNWPVGISPTRSSPVIRNSGILYIGTQTTGSTTSQGRLYAVETDSDGIRHSAPWPMIAHDLRHTGRNTGNQSPEADAGADQDATSGGRVSLDGSASDDPDFGIAAYSWTQTDGTSVTLSDEDTAFASFTAPGVSDAEPLSFELTVTDNGGQTSTDTVSVRVEEDDSFCFIRTVRRGIFSHIR